MSLRKEIREAVRSGRREEVERLVEANPKAVRVILAMTYDLDEKVRETACWGVGLSGRFHPELAARVIRNLIWSMNDESGAFGANGPAVLQAIAREDPDLLLPVVPDMVRLSEDENLHDGLADVLCVVVHNRPGKLGDVLTETLNRRIEKGECCGDDKREIGRGSE